MPADAAQADGTPAPKPDRDQAGVFLPNGAAAQAGLNRSVADAGWGVFLTILTSQAESAGRDVIAVDPRNTSRRCPECGLTAKENRPTQEKFHCVGCGHLAHADTVGAINVLRAGLVRREATTCGAVWLHVDYEPHLESFYYSSRRS